MVSECLSTHKATPYRFSQRMGVVIEIIAHAALKSCCGSFYVWAALQRQNWTDFGFTCEVAVTYRGGKKVTHLFRIHVDHTLRAAMAAVCAVTSRILIRFQCSWARWNANDL